MRDLKIHSQSWNGIEYLNSENPKDWGRILYKLIGLRPGYWDTAYAKFVEFVKILSKNWRLSIPDLLSELNEHEIGIQEFFLLERNTTFKLAALLGDVQAIYNRIFPDRQVDLRPAIARLSNAFLPRSVFLLEEYGVPRMISRKIHRAGVIDLESPEEIHEVIARFRQIGLDGLRAAVGTLDDFDIYILNYFYEGITSADAR